MWHLKAILIRNRLRLLVLAILLASASLRAQNLFFHLLPQYQNAPPLSITPGAMTLTLGQPWRFSAVGGIAPFTFSVIGSGGSVDSATGIYTADFAGGFTVAVRVTDVASQTADATVEVAAAPVITCTPWGWYGPSELAGRVIDSGGPSGNYVDDDFCTVNINTGTPLTIHFDAFDTEAGVDVLSAYDSAWIQTFYSGSTIPSNIVAADGYQYLEFVSNSSINAPGFDFSWSAPYKILPTLTASTNLVHITYSTTAWVSGGVGPYTFTKVSGAGSISSLADTQFDVTSQTASSTVFRVTDAINQTSDVTIDFYADTLSLSSVGPSHGGSAGGEGFSVYGAGILTGAVVTIGGNTCTSPFQWDSTYISCTTPAGTEGPKDVVVTNPGGGSFTLTGGYTYSYGSWSAMPTPSTAPRSYEVSIWTGDRWIIWGGDDPSCNYATCTKTDGFVYNPATDSWSAMAASPLAGRVDPAQVWTGHEVLIFGGRYSNTTGYLDGAKYDPYANTWTSITPASWTRRQLFSQVWTGKELIVFSGQWGGVHSTGAAYNPSTDTWRNIASGTARWMHQALWTGTKMVVYGGATDNGGTIFPSTLDAYDPEADTWSSLASPDIYGLFVGTWTNQKNSNFMVWTGDRLMLSGGYCQGTGNYSQGIYSQSTNSWSYPSNLTWSNSCGISNMIWTGSQIIRTMATGSGTNVFEAYDPAGDQTAFLPSVLENEIRAPIWTGKDLLTCYGYMPWYDPIGGTCKRLSLGGLANRLGSLSADSWIANTSTGAPSARSGGTTIWTGKYFIVWGGYDGSSYLNSGYKYDPFTDVWTSITTSGAPSGRQKHTALWTGSKMLIWGGQTAAGTQTNTGGLYDPATDSWTSTPSGAPTDTTWVNDSLPAGASPVSTNGDAWTWVSSSPSPQMGTSSHQSNTTSGEHQHYFTGATTTLSVGTGDTMFTYVYLDPVDTPTEIMLQWNNGDWEHRAYWGANNIAWGTDGTNSRRYMGALPTTGQWVRLDIPASSVGLEGSTLTGMAFTLYDGKATWDNAGKSGGSTPPAAREDHTADWTGGKMIVWGGHNSGGYLADGAIYDLASNTWTTLSTAGSPPSARSRHRSIFTGGKIVIWGGDDGSSFASTGASYDLTTQTWTALSNTSAPSARADFSMVLSQGKLVVWGGVNSSGTATNTGGIYDLANNTWTATSTTGAPSARSQAATAYTDRDMVVWGGKSGGTSYADGFLFDPRANTWTAMSSSGLSARYGAMPAWTGEVGDGRASGSLSYRNNTNGDTGRLIIWGGYDGSSYKADGKIYNLPNQ